MTKTVGIIGAGLSGLMVARLLAEHGLNVTLFDKGRRPGGRASTREHGSFRFDHGAQYFTVRNPLFRPLLESWSRDGIVAEWMGEMVNVEADRLEPAKDSLRYVGIPGMIEIAGDLARGLRIRTGLRVERLQREKAGWSFVDFESSSLGRFDLALVAVPAPQAVPLLSGAPDLRAAADEKTMAPCWAGMYLFEEPIHLSFDGAFIADGPLSWAARNSSKPGRPQVESWVLHARAEWTRRNRTIDQEEAANLMFKEFRNRFGPLPAPTFQRAHRWAYAQASDHVPEGALFDPELRIGACGDWCHGGRIEGAIMSGLALAEKVLGVGIAQLKIDRIMWEEGTS